MKKNLPEITSKSSLGRVLSTIKQISSGNFKLEQYQTSSEIAADLIWKAGMLEDIKNKIVLDAGTGNGILGIGASLLGAKKIIFLDIDKKSLKIAETNWEWLGNEYLFGESEFICGEISEFDKKIDVTIMNPPFGTKKKHADKKFLEKAFALSKVVYSIHKSTTKVFVKAISKDHKFEITHKWNYKFRLPKVYEFHQKKEEYTDITLFRMEKRL